MAIQVIKFPQPKLYASLVAGGSLAVGTTYYFAGFFQAGGGYYGSAVSSASEEISITPTSGNQSIKMEWWQDGGDVSAYADAGGGQVTVSATAHGRSNGDTVYIRGTTNYDGSYAISNVATDTFEISATWAGDDGASKWFADIGIPDYAYGIIFRWDKYSMIDSSDGTFFQWKNENDPAVGAGNEFSGTYSDYGHRKWTKGGYAYQGIRADNTIFTQEASSYGQNDYELYDGVAIGSTIYTSRGLAHPQLALQDIDSFYKLPDQIARDKGKLLILCDDTSANNENTLIDALQASGYDDMFFLSHENNGVYPYDSQAQNLILMGMMEAFNSSVNIFSDLNLTFICNTGMNGNNYDVYDTTFIRCNLLQVAGSSSYWIEAGGTYIDTTSNVLGSAYVLTGVHSDSSNFTPRGRMSFYYGSKDGFNMIGGSVMLDFFQWRYPNMSGDQKLTNFYIKDIYAYVYYRGTGVLNADIAFEDTDFINSGLQDQDIQCLANDLSGRVCAFTHTCKNMTSDREDGKIRVKFTSYGNPTSITDIFYSTYDINVKVVDEFGNAIQGATVSLTNEDGGVDSDITDANGDATVNGLSYTVEYDVADTDGYGLNSKTSDFKDLCFEVTKSGYRKYKVCGFTLNSGEDWIIPLTKVKDLNFSQRGKITT